MPRGDRNTPALHRQRRIRRLVRPPGWSRGHRATKLVACPGTRDLVCPSPEPTSEMEHQVMNTRRLLSALLACTLVAAIAVTAASASSPQASPSKAKVFRIALAH